MTTAHWHLVLNHIPLLGLLFGAGLLGYGLWRAEEAVQRASLGLLAVAGLTIIAVYLTGEPAEGIVEGLAGVSHDAIEAHEEMAWYALIAGVLTSIVSLGALIYGTIRRRLARWTVVLTLILALASTGLIGYTANLGGKISHPELRADVPVQFEGEIDASEAEAGEAGTWTKKGTKNRSNEWFLERRRQRTRFPLPHGKLISGKRTVEKALRAAAESPSPPT